MAVRHLDGYTKIAFALYKLTGVEIAIERMAKSLVPLIKDIGIDAESIHL